MNYNHEDSLSKELSRLNYSGRDGENNFYQTSAKHEYDTKSRRYVGGDDEGTTLSTKLKRNPLRQQSPQSTVRPRAPVSSLFREMPDDSVRASEEHGTRRAGRAKKKSDRHGSRKQKTNKSIQELWDSLQHFSR